MKIFSNSFAVSFFHFFQGIRKEAIHLKELNHSILSYLIENTSLLR